MVATDILVSYSGGATHLCLVPLAKISHFKYKYLYIEKLFGWYFICLFIFPGKTLTQKNKNEEKNC